MSNRYKGGIISATPPTTTGGETGVASGAWTLEQQLQAQAAGNWPIQPPPLYIENVFSTWLYTGTGATQTLPVGVNVNGFGGLELIKSRSQDASSNPTGAAGRWFAFSKQNATSTELAFYDGGTATTGVGTVVTAPLWFLPGGNNLISGDGINTNGATYASWTFRKQPKFFDVVTYSGNSVSGRQISHSLGSTPGCILVKVTGNTGSWFVWHRSMGGNNFYQTLNSTDPRTNGGAPYWNNTAPTSTVFTVGNDSDINQTGRTYVAYLFAHDAGGFGPTETDNVISCGSFTTDGSGNATVNLGYEPQWVMVKDILNFQSWYIEDNMRAFNLTSRAILFPNLANAEATGASAYLAPNATGFAAVNGQLNASATYIYIAIRRGPMAVPTTGTSVFSANFGNNLTGAGTIINSSMLVDMFIQKGVASGSETPTFVHDRLRGAPRYLQASGTNEELSVADWRLDQNTGVGYSTTRNLTSRIGWMFRRAPQFFDEVCYTGNDVARNLTHNLGAVPELWIVKIRSASGYSWPVGGGVLGSATNNFIILNSTSASSTLANFWATPTATTFGFGSGAPSDTSINQSGQTYVSYLFATCPGVSKVGSYTGTGATQVINCGFAAGARFVMIKATSTTGDWYVWDSTRGIVAGNDPYLEMNTADPEVTGTDWVDTAATGFELSNAGGNLANSNGVSYIFLAIA
jgi:hypothetical protein